MAQVAAGRSESLEPLVQRYSGPLVRFLHHLTGDRDRAEDLFQDTFLMVWRKRATYQFPRPFKPWLYTIAVNVSRAAFRTMKEFVMLSSDVPTNEPAGPPGQAIAAETAHRINRVIESMPPMQRAVVTLRIWEGLEYAEIASVIGKTEATVRSHMSHGLADLRAALA
jgi:RNA polymerase sigma-70 factor (ECF subfamily)